MLAVSGNAVSSNKFQGTHKFQGTECVLAMCTPLTIVQGQLQLAKPILQLQLQKIDQWLEKHSVLKTDMGKSNTLDHGHIVFAVLS